MGEKYVELRECCSIRFKHGAEPAGFFCPVFDVFGPFHRSHGLSELSKTFLHSALLPFDLEKAPGRKPLVAGRDMTRRLHLMS